MATSLNPRQVREPVSVQTYADGGGWGEGHSPARSTRCLLDARRRLVRDRNGEQVVSETTILLHPVITPDAEAMFATGSLVTVRGRESEVITVSPAISRGRVVYVEVALA